MTLSRVTLLKLFSFTTILIVLCILTIAWRVTPLQVWLTTEQLLSAATSLRAHPFAPLWIILAYIAGGLVSFPIVILIPVTAFICGPVFGPCYSLLGLLLNASLLYALGHLLGHKTVHHLAGERLYQVSQQLAHHGLLTTATLRVLPLAPFTIVNLVAGASHIRFRDYTAGTLIGVLPAIIVMSLIGVRLEKVMHDPVSPDLFIILGLTILLVAATLWLKYRFSKRNQCNKLT